MNYSILIAALVHVESHGNPMAVNGDAVGILQIRNQVIADVNAFCHTSYKPKDRTNPDRSKEICHLYLAYWGEQYKRRTGKEPTYDVLARIWNGGPRGYEKSSTLPYWWTVRKALNGA